LSAYIIGAISAAEKRAALDARADHVDSSVEGRANAGNVVVFEKAR
jgi:hypothetical protein